jgi:hypothetical protein
MFAYTAPVPPFGGLAWQEVQFAAESGDAAAWHDVQTGPGFVDVPVSSWQEEHAENSGTVFTA